MRAAGSAKVRRARSSEERLRRIFFSLTKTYMEVGKPEVTPAEAGHFRTYYLTALGPTGIGTTPFQKPARNGPRNP